MKTVTNNSNHRESSGQRRSNSDMNESADASSQPTWESIDDRDIAAAAIKLAISSSRKSFTTLCTKIGLILKENVKLKKELSRLTEIVKSQVHSQTGTELSNANMEQKSDEKLSTEAPEIDSTRCRIPTSFTVTAEIHCDDKQMQELPCQHNCTESETMEKPNEESAYGSLSTFNLSKTCDGVSRNQVENCNNYWKNEYLKQIDVIDGLRRQLKELQSKTETVRNVKTADKSVECKIITDLTVERESEEKYLDCDGWQSVLKHLHHIPVVAPVVLFGCKCSRCEYMSKPVFYATNKDVKMYEMVSNISLAQSRCCISVI
ncbi:hypothetical protein CHUAL_002437 [Chamberlinius hualienensis]